VQEKVMSTMKSLSLVAILGALVACGEDDDIAALEARVAALEADASAGSVPELIARVGANEDALDALAASLAILQVDVVANSAAIEDLTETVSLVGGVVSDALEYEIVQVSRTIDMAPGDQGVFVTAYCPSDKNVLGGGYASGGFFTFVNSGPVGDSGWQVLVVNRHTLSFSAPVTVSAICAVVEE